MQILRMGLIAAGVTLLAANAAIASEQEVLRDGKAEFQSYCVACHGEDAKGDGRMAEILTIKPANLTTIAKRNGGVFPFWRVYGTIDGTVPTKGHEYMPNFESRFRADEPKPGYTLSYLRILTLTHYLESIQEK